MENNTTSNSADLNKHKENISMQNKSKDGSNRELFSEEKPPSNLQQPPPQQPNPFPAYNHSTTDSSNVDNNMHVLSEMSGYNTNAAMTSKWGVNPVDGMPMTPTNMPGNSTSTTIPMATGMDITNSFAYMGMPSANNMYDMMGAGNYCQYGIMNGMENMMSFSVKSVVSLTKCTLYPPNPNSPPPTTRERPLGCKTVFVGGLPEAATEEIMKEAFQIWGEILKIRMSKKNFCHIRFSYETSVDKALYFSGYRMKIENKDEPAFTGKLHVDYAQARDDQHEYECQQRDACHWERMEQNSRPSLPPIVHYSEHEAMVLGEKLRNVETFQQAVHVLTTWLKRGECNKRSAGTFYSMIQSIKSHARRLMNEKVKYEDQLNKAKILFNQQMQGVLLQFAEIDNFFNMISFQVMLDSFTKGQRKNIEIWKRETEEIKNAHIDVNAPIKDEMDLSEGDENDTNKIQDATEIKKKVDDALQKLREECNALRLQLEGAENEAILKESEFRQVIEFQSSQIQDLKEKLEKESRNPKRSSEEAELKDSHSCKKKVHSETENPDTRNNSASISSPATFNEREGFLISLVSIFLHVHPFGANIDYICSYLHQIDSTIQLRDVENLMKQFPSIFIEFSTGIGASLGKKWKFIPFH